MIGELIGALYHWSPKERRASIAKEGLVPGCEPTAASSRITWISLGTTPSAAWGLSGDMDWVSEEHDEWDLWQVRLQEGDDVRIRSEFGPYIAEIKVFSTLPADRLWWIGERTPWQTAEEQQ